MKTTAAVFACCVAAALADDGAKDQKGCDPQAASLKSGQYDVAQNVWNLDKAGPSSSQCLTADDKGFKVSWSYPTQNTDNDKEVKSYPNIKADVPHPAKLVADVKSIPSKATWSYKTPNPIKADVAYDIFTSAKPDHNNYSGDYEFMVWLGRYGGPNPIGEQIGNFTDKDNNTWEFWSGDITVSSGPQHTYSFVAEKNLTDWTGDIKPFMDHARDVDHFDDKKQYLLNVQFGTEPSTGQDAVFELTEWSAEVKV